MPERVLHVLRNLGLSVDLGVFGTVLGMFLTLGYSASEIGTILAGIGAFAIGLGRLIKFIGETIESIAKARVHSKFGDPEFVRTLLDLRCWHAPDCPYRELFNLEKEEH